MSWICDVTGYNQCTEQAWLISRKPEIIWTDKDGQSTNATVDQATDTLISHIEREKRTVHPLVLLAYACRTDTTFKAQQNAPVALDIFCLACLISNGRGWNSHSTLKQFFAEPRTATDFVDFWHTRLSPDQRRSIVEHMVKTCKGDVTSMARQGHLNYNWPLMDRIYQTLVPENMTEQDAILVAQAYGESRDKFYLEQNIASATTAIERAERLCTTLPPTAVPYRSALRELQRRQHSATGHSSTTPPVRKLREDRVRIHQK